MSFIVIILIVLQFLLIFQKAAMGELTFDGLKKLADLSEINVSEEGVSGAKNFFEAKVSSTGSVLKFVKKAD